MAENLTKAELIAKIAEVGEISKVKAKSVFEILFSEIGETVRGGGKFTLVGFGTFYLKTRAARTGRNPKTGETLKIAASSNVAFKGAKSAAKAHPDKKTAKK